MTGSSSQLRIPFLHGTPVGSRPWWAAKTYRDHWEPPSRTGMV